MTDSPAHGAYGFRIEGAGKAVRLLAEVPDSWPGLSLRQLIGEATRFTQMIGDDSAVIPLEPEGALELDRVTGSVTYLLPDPIGVEALVHPYLAPAAAVHATWRGWNTYHAAGVVLGGAVWGIAGDREVGKSTLVAALAARGRPVMADDLLVLQDSDAVCGPRTVDLRESAADRFGATRQLGVTGMRARWRMDLGPAPTSAPFAGWIYPEWADEIEVTALSLHERVDRPHEHRAAAYRPVDPGHALWMARLPAYRFGRPQSWDALDHSLDALLAAIEAQSDSSSE